MKENRKGEMPGDVSGLTRENTRLKILNDFAIKLISILTEKELAWYSAREVVGKLGFDDCVIYFFDHQQQILFQVAAIGDKNPAGEEIINRLEIPIGKGITGAVAQSRTSIVVEDLSQDQRYIVDLGEACSEICVPILHGGVVLGVIDSEHPDVGHYNNQDLQVLEAIAALMGAKLNSLSQAQDLQESERRFRNFFKHPLIGAAIYRVVDKSWISASDTFCQMMGYTREELSPLTWVDLTHPDDLQENIRLFDLAVSGEGDSAYSMEKRFIRKHGETIYAEIHAQCIRDRQGEPDYCILSVRNITDRKIAEDKIRESADEIQSMLNTMQDIFYRTNTNGRMVLVSPSIKELLGYSPEEILGKKWGDYYIDPDGRAGFLAELEKCDGKVSNFEAALRHKDGSTVWASASSHYWIKNGKALGVEGTIRDVSRQKHTELALLQAKEAAETSNRAKSDFLANMSHELRTPLNAILGFSQILEGQILGPIGQDKYCEYAQDIGHSGQHLLALISDVLDISKIEAGGKDIHEERLNLTKIAIDCKNMVAERAFAARVSLSLSVPDDIPDLWADERRVKQILLNLLSNSIKFTLPDGRVEIDVGHDNERGVQIEVRDTGIGIAKQHIPTIMEPFKQIREGSLQSSQPGTGLGLSLVRSLTELHGGSVTIESELKAGTSVRVNFPPERTVI